MIDPLFTKTATTITVVLTLLPSISTYTVLVWSCQKYFLEYDMMIVDLLKGVMNEPTDSDSDTDMNRGQKDMLRRS